MAKAQKQAQQRPAFDAPFAPPDWPAMKIERRRLKTLKPHPKNPKTHPDYQIESLGSAITEFGVTRAIVIDENDQILAGHGQRLAGIKRGIEEMPVFVARGWSEDKKLAFMLADNRLGDIGGYDDTMLRENVQALQLAGFNMDTLGFDPPSLEEILGVVEDDGANRGNILELIKITIAEPKHQVLEGDHWMLGERHHLLCVSVISDWLTWKNLLNEDALFCPYPGVFVPFCAKAKTNSLIMVQPDTYIAGHILDRYAESFGEQSVKKV